MTREITAGDFVGKHHVVIVATDEGSEVFHFTGDDAMEKAHLEAQRIALKNKFAYVTVAVVVRTIKTAYSMHLSAT